MTSLVHGFDWPDRFVVGTVGAPGSREFFLQAQEGSRVASVGLEKAQSAALAEGVATVLDQLMAEDGNPYSVPEVIPAGLEDSDPLAQPVEEMFRAGPMQLAWDPSTRQVVIHIASIETDIDADTDSEPLQALVVRIPVGAARAFATRTMEVVVQGRPACPLCGEPMDPEGHVCAAGER